MLIMGILSGPVRLTNGSQSDQLETVIQKLRACDKPATIILDSGQKITISKVLEGGDGSESLLSVDISK